MWQYPRRHGKSHLYHFGSEHRLRTPSSQLLPDMQDDDRVGILHGQIEVVHNGQDAHPLARKALGSREGAVLMCQIETRCGLVEQQIAVAY